VVTIHVRSTVRTAIVVPSYTLPASTKTVTLDQAAAYYIRDVRGRENQESTYDVIEVRGARPWVGITLGFSLSDSSLALRKGWTAGLESGWNARPNFSIYQNVWRRFEVRPDWDGSQYNNPSTGLRNAFLRSHGSNDPAYGQAGLTGERVFGVTGAGYEVPTNLLTAEAELPCSVGFSTLRIGPRQRAVVVMGAGSGWYDFSTWSVSIQSSPLAVLIDDGQDGRLLQGFLEAGQTLLVTIGMREISDLAVSWQRPVTDWPGPVPRTKLIEDSGYDQWIALAGCVTGTSIDGTTLTTLASDVTVRDDVAQMRAHLALKRPWFAQPDWYYSWRFVGLADFTDDYRSGTLLTEVNRGDRTDQTNVIIAPRRWGTERIDDILIYTTYFATERILPSINMTL
jgi:hypothetical protein